MLLRNALSAAKAGVAPWPAPIEPCHAGVRWNWPRLAVPTLGALMLLFAGLFLPVSKPASHQASPDEPLAWKSLESSLDACYGGQGVIHVPDILFNALVAQHLVVQVGGPNGPRLQTTRGNLIAVGAGYPGTAPDGTQPVNAVWMYATGAVFGYRGMEPAPDGNMSAAYNVRDWLDRANNTMKVQAERTYLLGWDCCHFGVQVSLGGIVTGQPLTAF